MVGEGIVSEVSVSGGNSSFTSGLSSRRQRLSYDGRSPRRLTFEVDFRIRPSVSLPPFTGGLRGINVDQIDRRYPDIAVSICDLDRQGLVRAVTVINDDIIKAIKDLNGLGKENGDS